MATGIPRNGWNGVLDLCYNETSLDMRLMYEGKKPESEILKTSPPKIKLLRQHSCNLDNPNRLYFGDNLPILASLLQDPSIKGKIKLVYIDPPFSTGSIFQSRSQTDAYHDLLNGSHYVEFLRERLVLLRELLAEDGSIYVHLDNKMVFHIKLIMDEVFGKHNFRNWITRKKCNPKNYTRKAYGNISDYILFYTKSENYIWNRPLDNWTPEKAEKEYIYLEEGTNRRYKKVPIHAPGIRHGETGRPWRGMNPPPGKHWQFTPANLDAMDARGEIYWSPNGNPRRKVYLDESEGIMVQDRWLDFKDAHNQMVKISGYPTEKNAALLERIIKTSSNPGDWILDCFSGSGTSLAVASTLNRKWIGIDNSREAIITSLRRFYHGLKRMGDYVTANTQKPIQGKLVESHEPITDFFLFASDADSSNLTNELTLQEFDVIQPSI